MPNTREANSVNNMFEGGVLLTMSQAASVMGLPLSSVSRRARRSFFSLTCSSLRV